MDPWTAENDSQHPTGALETMYPVVLTNAQATQLYPTFLQITLPREESNT